MMTQKTSGRWSVSKSTFSGLWVVWSPGGLPEYFYTFNDAWAFVSEKTAPSPGVVRLAVSIWNKFQPSCVTPHVALEIARFVLNALGSEEPTRRGRYYMSLD